jgi:hypothetical protein
MLPLLEKNSWMASRQSLVLILLMETFLLVMAVQNHRPDGVGLGQFQGLLALGSPYVQSTAPPSKLVRLMSFSLIVVPVVI